MNRTPIRTYPAHTPHKSAHTHACTISKNLQKINNHLINIHIFAVFLAAPSIPGGAIPPKWHQKGMCGVCAGYVRMGFNMPAQISYFWNLGILWFPAGPLCLKFEAPASWICIFFERCAIMPHILRYGSEIFATVSPLHGFGPLGVGRGRVLGCFGVPCRVLGCLGGQTVAKCSLEWPRGLCIHWIINELLEAEGSVWTQSSMNCRSSVQTSS